MSALAARRAAAAAAPPVVVAATPPSPQQESEPPSDSESETESVSSISSASAPPSPKRRKTRARSPKVTRYFNNDPQPPRPAPVPAVLLSKRHRRFSPSAPMSDGTPSEEEEVDSSVGGSDLDMAEEDEYEDEARNDVDEGRVQWSTPATPAVESSMPGPSRLRNKPATQAAVTEASSSITLALGVNYVAVSEEDLHSAGVTTAGPGVVVGLGEDENLVIAGLYTVTPLQRDLSIASSTLSPSSTVAHPVFAPTSHPLPILSPVVNPPKRQLPSPILSNLSLPKSFQTKDGSGRRTIFLVQENRCGIDGLRYGAVPGFANIWLEEEGSWGLWGVHPVVGSFPTPVYPHITPSSWSDALTLADTTVEDPRAPLVGIVKGPKRSGKSTFARSLLNNLLGRYSRVAWLECDLGQGEFGCGGVVGLWVVDRPVLGPSFSHPIVPLRAHYLGTYTPLTCPDEYIAAVRHTIEHYKYEVQYSSESAEDTESDKISGCVPLVINTQGWVKGLGEDLLRAIEMIAEPTHVYAFSSPVDEESGYQGPGWTSSPPWRSSELPGDGGYPYAGAADPSAVATRTFTLEPAPVSPLQARYTAADFRVLSTISYFHSSRTSASSPSWDFSSPLQSFPPWEVEFGLGKAIERVYLLGEGSEGVLEDDLPLALNGSIVALVELLETPDEPEDELYVQARLPPSLDSTNVLGLALVRALSPGKLQLLTPLPAEHLARCRAIVKNGAIELPTCGMLDWRRGGVGEEGMMGKAWKEVPFLDVSGVNVVGGERRKFRKNIMRKGQ
ncbi:hypothetical protein IAT38_005186 [Cryptococcus sp. DSM 104549]